MKRESPLKVKASGLYSIKEAARFLNVHRCTIYRYLRECGECTTVKSENGSHQLFSGAKLLHLKNLGYPRRRGRKPTLMDANITLADI